jgi:hypothetical protein
MNCTALDGQIAFDGQQNMKMIGHDHELVQAELPLSTIVVKDANE